MMETRGTATPSLNLKQPLRAAYKLCDELVVVLGAHVSANTNLWVRGCAKITRADSWPKHHLNPPLLTSPLLAQVAEKAMLAPATTNNPQRDI
jgi:hypothetical protein